MVVQPLLGAPNGVVLLSMIADQVLPCMCAGMCADMCTDMSVHMYAGMRSDTCTYLHAEVCVDTCTDMRACCQRKRAGEYGIACASRKHGGDLCTARGARSHAMLAMRALCRLVGVQLFFYLPLI